MNFYLMLAGAFLGVILLLGGAFMDIVNPSAIRAPTKQRLNFGLVVMLFGAALFITCIVRMPLN